MSDRMGEPRTATGMSFYRGNAIRGFEAKLARTIRAIEDEAAAIERSRLNAAAVECCGHQECCEPAGSDKFHGCSL